MKGETFMRIGFIGLGNVGYKLANSLISAGHNIYVHDLEKNNANDLIKSGADWVETPKELAAASDIAITCLPSPTAVADVVEGPNGLVHGMSEGKVWIEMSTTDSKEMLRLGTIMEKISVHCCEAPVSGGCHRAATGNIAILVGGSRTAFDLAFPALKAMGYQILHVGELGKASAPNVDAVSFMPALRGTSLASRLLYWHFPAYLEGNDSESHDPSRPFRTTPCGATREGDWKLIEYFEDGNIELFNLALDPEESSNRAKDEPARVESMRSQLHLWQNQVGAPMPTLKPSTTPASTPR